MHWKGLRLLSSLRAQETSCCTNFNSLCSELHLGTLLLLAPVVSLQYLVGSYGYSCTISVCLVQFLFSRFLPIPCLCLTAVHLVITPVQVKIGCQSLSLVVFLFHYQGLHQFSPREITVTESNFFGEITTPSDPWTFGTQLFPCAVILLVFHRFITNCYIYENSTVWIILPLSKFPGKIGGVTLVPLKTQPPRQNFLGHIYPSYCLSVYTTIC
jgi:hypothetical protein